MKKFLGFVIVLALLAVAGCWYLNRANGAAEGFRTTPVKRDSLVAVISATGTVEPEEVIDVGAQVAGKVNFFGKDPHNPTKTIDYGSVVEEGTVLAQIDDSLYRADTDQAEAGLAAAKANVTRAEADLGQLKAKLDQAEADWKRAQEVGTTGGLSQSDIDARRATYLTAKANLEVGDAAVAQAQTGVAQADATLKKSKTNLSYTTIKSPVKGVIIDRRVNTGQTVVASLNAPSLFLIAKDLTRIQVWASVNEADIGTIHPGQPATFTVDAYPGHTFKGTVNKVRLNATMTQNVVTYTVEVTTDNSDGKLLPYLTANVQFEVKRRDDVLIVPTAALRWFPKTEQVVPEEREKIAAMTRGRTERSGPPTTRPAGGLVWIPEGKLVRPLRVNTGMSDGINTEVDGENVSENMQVVTGELRGDSAGGEQAAQNPFMPSFGGKRKGG